MLFDVAFAFAVAVAVLVLVLSQTTTTDPNPATRILSQDYDFDVGGDVPAHPGLYLYSVTKGLSHELGKVFAANYPLHYMYCAFYHFKR